MRNKNLSVSYKGTILSVENDGKIVVRLEELHDDNRHKANEAKMLVPPMPMLLPVLDSNRKVIPGQPVCLDIEEDDGGFRVTLAVVGSEATVKFSKKGNS